MIRGRSLLSAETEKLFKCLLKEIRPLFKENGFRASGQNFVFESAECWVIVNFQKSRYANADETTFYVNVAASSKRWLGFYGKPADKVPSCAGCDWRWRVEHFGPDKDIQQWTLRDEHSLEQTLKYLRSLFAEFVLPATKLMATEADLIKHTGGFEYPQLKTCTVIFAATNQINALRESVAKLIEKFSSGVVAEGTRKHLELLRSEYPEAMHKVEFQVGIDKADFEL
jgi:hypothetical protein